MKSSTNPPIEESIMADPWELEPRRKNPSSYFSHNLSRDLKRAAFKASAVVVGIISYLGEGKNIRGSGFVVESVASNGKFISTVLTSASLLRPQSHIDAVADDIEMNVIVSDEITCQGGILAYDFHLNIGAIKIETDIPITTAKLRYIDDSISIDPNLLFEKPSTYHPQSQKFNLVPGDTVIALGRCEQNELMVVAGKFSVTQTRLDCRELFRAECVISRNGIGGPLINCYGEVIGMDFYCGSFTPFLPINIVSLWWEQFKKNGNCLLPRVGMVLGNLYTGEAAYLEFVIQRFPNIFKGAFVEIISESPAYCTAIMPCDLIVGCDGKFVGSVLEFFELIWDKVGQAVHLDVLRPSDGSRLNVNMTVGNIGPNKLNRWPLPRPSERGSSRRLRI